MVVSRPQRDSSGSKTFLNVYETVTNGHMPSRQSENKPKRSKSKSAGARNRPKARPRTSVGKAESSHAMLSRPAQEYARAMADPFTGPLATIPDFPSVPSRRVRCFARGYFYAGTTGFGFIAVDPYISAANNGLSIRSTEATFAGSTIVNSGTGITAASTNSDYSITDFGVGNLAQGRIVGAGLRVKYSGTELNRGGVLLGLTSPNHQSLLNFSFTDLDKFDCAVRFRPDQKWFTTLYCPVRQEELLFTRNLGSPAGDFVSGTYVNNPIMAFAINAPSTAAGSAFQYEFYLVYEVQGVSVRGVAPSLSDPTGFSAVQTTAQLTMQRAHDLPSDQRAQLLVQHTGQVAAQTISGWAGKAANSAIDWVTHNGASILGNLAVGAMSML